MNVLINCTISLSKKLRNIIGNGNEINLIIYNIKDGRGIGTLSMSGDSEINKEEVIQIGETSIMLTPVDVKEELPENIENGVSVIFSNLEGKTEDSSSLKKIAVTKAPEKGKESKAMRSNVSQEVPESFSELKNPKCMEYVKNLKELIDAVSVAMKNKKSKIDINDAKNEREKFVLSELKEKEEAIDTLAFIVNDSVGNLTINDLDISLPMNVPYDLRNISARRIMASSDLKGLLNEKYVRFISPEECSKFYNMVVEEKPSLDVFDSPEEAEGKMFRKSLNNEEREQEQNNEQENNTMEITDQDMNEPTEESSIINLIKNIPKSKPINRQTSHSNVPSRNNQSDSSNKKSIRRVD